MKKKYDFEYLNLDTCSEKPIVSILVLAYNHEKYIGQAIESIVCQKTNFPYEIVIGEDYSSDMTRSICLDYLKRYPNKIKLLLQNSNKGLIGNFCDTMSVCKGKYIAECAGDDFWADCYKLQKHIDYMEKYSDVIVTYHDAKTVDENNNIIDENFLTESCKKNFSSDELCRGMWIIPQSMCYRSLVIPVILKNINKNVYNEDAFQISIFGEFGRGVYLKNIEKVAYRMTQNSIWSMKSIIHKSLMSAGTYGELYKYYKNKNKKNYSDFYKQRLVANFSEILNCKLESSEKRFAFIILKRYWIIMGFRNSFYYLRNLI